MNAKEAALSLNRNIQNSDAWAQTKETAESLNTQAQKAAVRVQEEVSVVLRGPVASITFTERKLGLTLSCDEESGKAIVSRVDLDGAAATLGVQVGQIVVSIKSARSDTITIDTYEQLMSLFPAMGRPVTIGFITPFNPTSGYKDFFMASSMADEIFRATNTVQNMTARLNMDAVIPQAIINRAAGLAFFRISKLGFGISFQGGTGVMVARAKEGNENGWSAPILLSMMGTGYGMQIGAEVSQVLMVLNSVEAVRAFTTGQQIVLGGNMGIAAGVIGRKSGINGNFHGGPLLSDASRAVGTDGGTPLRIAPCYCYCHSKGLFMGISLEGAIIQPRDKMNEEFYGTVTLNELLFGNVPPPTEAANLYAALNADLDTPQPRPFHDNVPSNISQAGEQSE
uniref:Ysc84 actin-binding domain-containing protein n=1 Tax=Octactis speculum TaxID=3111310 RepID=A0A7S2DHI1_9STRA